MPRLESKLDSLAEGEKRELIRRLHTRQGQKCYVCGREINLTIDKVDIDHIKKLGVGPDEEQNWGLTHESCNRSKGARDLQLMQYIYDFRLLKDAYVNVNKDFTVGDALEKLQPQRQEVVARIDDSSIKLSYRGKDGISVTESFKLYTENGDHGFTFFTGLIPFQLLFHDSSINPRSLVDLEPMIEEFYDGYPQLQPSLGHMEFNAPEGRGRLLLFDGQHKAAAQLFNRKERLFVRVFVNSALDKLKAANFRAHTIVAQIHFPDMIRDKVGHDIFKLGFDAFKSSATPTDSEQRFLFRTETGEDYRDYLKNFVKYAALFSGGQRHKILNYVETISARSRKFPISYDTLEKTFLRFLYLQPAEEPLGVSSDYRELERRNLSTLMDIFVEEILENRYKFEKGVYRIEEQLSSDPNLIENNHLAAYRICRQAAMIVWLTQFKMAVIRLLKTRNRYLTREWGDERPLWAEFKEEDWKAIRRMFGVVRDHQIWIEKHDKNIIQAIESTKQKDWKQILLEGRLPDRPEKLFPPLDDNTIFNTIFESRFR